MTDKEFIKYAKLFLKYSFKPIMYDYNRLTIEEKKLISEGDFNLFIKNIKDE